MTAEIRPSAAATIHYPDSDGQPMADNTLQFRWIVTIKEGLEALFADDPNVFVAGDFLWYPVEGRPDIRVAPDAMGGAAFDRDTNARAGLPRDEQLNGTEALRVRSASCAALNAPIEIATPTLRDAQLEVPLVARASLPRCRAFEGSTEAVVLAVALELGMGVADIRSRSRARPLVHARRVALWVWRQVNRSAVEMASYLGLSESAASRLVVAGGRAVDVTLMGELLRRLGI